MKEKRKKRKKQERKKGEEEEEESNSNIRAISQRCRCWAVLSILKKVAASYTHTHPCAEGSPQKMGIAPDISR